MEDNLNLENAVQKLSEMLGTEDGQKQISDIISALTGNSDEENQTEEAASKGFELSSLFNSQNKESSSQNGFSPDLITKAMKLMSHSTGQNQSTAFLKALKPYLHQSRRQKVDSAIKILSFADIFKELGGTFFKGGDNDL